MFKWVKEKKERLITVFPSFLNALCHRLGNIWQGVVGEVKKYTNEAKEDSVRVGSILLANVSSIADGFQITNYLLENFPKHGILNYFAPTFCIVLALVLVAALTSASINLLQLIKTTRQGTRWVLLPRAE